MDISFQPDTAAARPRLRVFIVDDVPSARAGLRAFLSLAPDIEVVGQAEDGAEALRQISANPPDIVIMDIEMPRMAVSEAAAERAQELETASEELAVRGVETAIVSEVAMDVAREGADEGIAEIAGGATELGAGATMEAVAEVAE